MKFYKCEHYIGRHWFYILPTIVISDDARYRGKAIRLEIHWLSFHISWLWVDERI